MPGYATGMSAGAVSAAIAQAVPVASDATPPATALDGKGGSSTKFAREDHTHAARVQRTVVTTAADGTYRWAFARPITCPRGALPPLSYMVDDTGSPVVVQITAREFTTSQDGLADTHTAVTIKAQRSRVLPAVLLSLAALLSFDVFGGAAPGVKVNLWAADPTQ
ncbi:hypothetical protein ASF59_09915 [Methylobacterium sp. Leaf121]|nr:hypothetical protein ASF59_09915 [Methylobacterium sp. Leaf121]